MVCRELDEPSDLRQVLKVFVPNVVKNVGFSQRFKDLGVSHRPVSPLLILIQTFMNLTKLSHAVLSKHRASGPLGDKRL
jgi:hypothetical protein